MFIELVPTWMHAYMKGSISFSFYTLTIKVSVYNAYFLLQKYAHDGLHSKSSQFKLLLAQMRKNKELTKLFHLI